MVLEINYKYVQTVTKRPDIYKFHKEDSDSKLINHGINNSDPRLVIEIQGKEWPASSPEECTYERQSGDWYRVVDTAEEYLLCPGCGLDCT